MLLSFAVVVIGIVAGFVDATVASGGLISIPMLVFLGFPAPVAIATDRLGSVGVAIGALAKFWNSKKIQWKFVPIFSLCALVGAYLGAKILFTIDPKALGRIIGLILLLLLPLFFFKPALGFHSSSNNSTKRTIGFIIYFFIMIYNGFFDTGASPLAIYNSIYFFGFTIIEANATAYIPWMVLSLVSLIIFVQHNIVNYLNGLLLLVGMTIGGYFGAHSLLKIGDKWVKRLFIIVVVLLF